MPGRNEIVNNAADPFYYFGIGKSLKLLGNARCLDASFFCAYARQNDSLVSNKEQPRRLSAGDAAGLEIMLAMVSDE